MRAAVYPKFSDDVDTIEVREVPDPKVAPGSVLIEVKAAGVNPVDWKVMTGALDQLIDAHFPVIPGWDVAGVVIATGMDTPEFSVGDEVMAYARKDVLSQGSFAEKIDVPAYAVALKPKGLTWAQAAALPLAGGTALRTLDALGPLEGKTVLIYGAAGGVGSAGVQIAKAQGAAKVIGTASENNHDYVRSLGAEPLTYGPGLAERIKAIAPDGVDVVADFVGGQLDTTKAVLKPGGKHASIADPTVVEHGGRHIWVRPDGKLTARLAELVDQGKLHVNVSATYPLEQVPDAFRASQTGHQRGKIVIQVAKDA